MKWAIGMFLALVILAGGVALVFTGIKDFIGAWRQFNKGGSK